MTTAHCRELEFKIAHMLAGHSFALTAGGHHEEVAHKIALLAADAASPASKLPALRCDECDNGIDPEWVCCPWCGYDKIATAAASPASGGEEKDEAYRQRNHLVAALARLFPSGIRPTNIEGWDPEWHGCVLIDLPSGQISYHYHDNEAHLFAELPPYTKDWDGHDKATVHKRLAELGTFGALAASPAPAVTEEWRTDIENAPKDGSDVLFPIEFVGRAYWCGDLKRWVLSRPLHMEFISHPTQFRTTPHQPAAMIRGDGA